MDELAEHHERSTLRPRWSAWWRDLGWIVLWSFGIALGCARGQAVINLRLLEVLLTLGGSFLGYLIWREWRRVPTVLRYWIEDRIFALTVRNAHSGEVLLRSVGQSLAGFELSDRRLVGASLTRVDLQAANLERADLRGADLRGCQFVGTLLDSANLRGANLNRADLTRASLRNADLRHARMVDSHWHNTDLRGADLRGADFAGRGVTRVIWLHSLGEAQLTGARYDATTRWPPGFDPLEKGCVYTEDAGAGLPIPAETEVARAEQLPIPTETSSATVPARVGDQELAQQQVRS